MGAHTTHAMHANSVAAFDSLDLNKRQALVLSAFLLANAPITDRECAQRLGFDDMNSVRPAITRLTDNGRLWEVDRVKCSVTGKTVRVSAPTSLARKGGA